MANTIDVAFIKQFESEVHMAYQRMGSKLKNTIRNTQVSGNTVRFKKSVLVLLLRRAAMVPLPQWNWRTQPSKPLWKISTLPSM